MIREPAAKRLARQLLEPRISRISPLNDEFIDTVARMIMTYVECDEQAQRSEQLQTVPRTVPEGWVEIMDDAEKHPAAVRQPP